MGFSLGLITSNYAPIYAGAGAGIGVVIGSIIGHYKLEKKLK